MFFFDKFEVQLLGGVISGFIVELQITPPNITAQIFLVFEMWRFLCFLKSSLKHIINKQ